MSKFWSGKRVLITGYAGFLGSWLTRRLVGEGAKVVGIDRVTERPISVVNEVKRSVTSVTGDIGDIRLIKRIFDKYGPQYVFHVAAEAIVSDCNRDPLRCFKANIEGTWNVLETARQTRGLQAVICASSDKAYGSHKKLPYREDAPLHGDHPYDVSKSCTDLLCYTYFNTYKLPVCVTRCGNIYGGGDMHMTRIVPDAMRCLINGDTLKVRSDGKFTRDYVYVEDIANGYILLAEKMLRNKLAGQAFNFSDENPITVLELIKEISSVTQRELPFKVLNRAKYEIKHQYLSSTKARRVLGWKPQYKLRQGLKKTIDWYQSHL